MIDNEQYYSFKKKPKKELLVGFMIIIITIMGFLFTYLFIDKFFFDKHNGKTFFGNPDDLNSVRMLNYMFLFLLVIFIIIVSIFLIRGLIKGIFIFFQRERVVLAKITKISTELFGEFDDLVDLPNASLSKSLAKNFKQVTIHQKAVKGRISKISIFASQTRFFSYPSSLEVFHHLSGIFTNLGIKIERFSNEDFIEYSKDLSSEYGNPKQFLLRGLGLQGEPAYQHIKKFTTPVDGLVKAIVDKSQQVEIHTFSTIRQGSSFRYWLKKKTLPRKKDREDKTRELTKVQQHKISETEDMETSGYVNGEVTIVIKGFDRNDIDKIKHEMIGSLDSSFDGFTRKVAVKEIRPQKILSKVKNHELIINSQNLISGYSARAIIDVYRKPMSGIPIVKDVTTPPSEFRPLETHPIILGETITGEEIRTNIYDHIHHCGIFGTTGFGKSDWIRAEIEQLLEHYPKIANCIIDFDGEYAKAFINHPDFLIFEANNPDAPLHINPFEGELGDLTEHADSLNSYFNEVLSIDQKYGEFTPPQKDILWQGIIRTVEQEDVSNKNFATFEREVKDYIELNRHEFVRGDMSAKSLLLKLRFYKRELRNIVTCNRSNFTPELLENHHIIFNLRSVRSEVGKRALVMLLLYQIRNYLLKKNSQELWLKLYIEEAVIVTPKTQVKTFIDECLSVIRKSGASFTLIGTTGEEVTKFILESPYLVNAGCVSKILCEKMNTELKTQHSLKKFQIDIKLPNEEYPIRLVKLTRPKREKLEEYEYEHFIQTHSKYEELRSRSFILEEDTSELEEREDNKRRTEAMDSLFESCLSNCSFDFFEKKDCHLMKTTKLTQLLKEAIRKFVREFSDWEGLQGALRDDFSDVMDRISILIETEVHEEIKIGRRNITDEDRQKLGKCSLFWILRGLIQNTGSTLVEVSSYFVDYEMELEKLQSSPYGFDTESEEYQFNVGDYNNDWETN